MSRRFYSATRNCSEGTDNGRDMWASRLCSQCSKATIEPLQDIQTGSLTEVLHTMSTLSDVETIEIRLEQTMQLFDNHDPYPFRERSLDQAVESYIVGHMENLPARRRIRIVVHLPRQEAASPAASLLKQAIARHFSERANTTQRSLSGLFRVGRRALVIGLTVLAVSLVAVRLAENLPGARLPKLFAEGLTIFGWVANWRPMEIFLYDWWPIARQRNIYRRLSEAEVSVKAFD
jgi:hypothetical protein